MCSCAKKMTVMMLEAKHILITGGTGYLATSLVTQLQNIDCCITRLSRPGARFTPLTVKGQIQDIEGDVRDRVVWETALTNVDFVLHLAAQTSVYVAEQNPLADLDSNVLPILHLLETCRDKKICPTILFSGTATEVGWTASLPVSESHSDHPITVYDLHKWIADKYLCHYARERIVNGVVLRLANVFGPGPKSSSAERGMLNMMIRKALRGEALTIYGDGNYIRDYIYVEDAARAFLDAAAAAEHLNGQYFVIGSGRGHTVAQAIHLVAERVERKTGRRAQVMHVPPPASLSLIETRNFVADPARFIQATGWQANITLIEGIDRTIDYFLRDVE